MTGDATPRYRHDGDFTCIDVGVRTLSQLFDGRDPAPFRERDLDEDAVEYILSAAEEIDEPAPLKVVFWIREPAEGDLAAETLREAFAAHFAHEVRMSDLRLRRHVQRAQVSLLLGLLVLSVFLLLAEATKQLDPGAWQNVLREGLVITGWVAMWRPLELLLYDWWPLVKHRRLRRRVQSAEAEIAIGRPPSPFRAARV